MIYLKSVFAGIATLLISVLLVAVGLIVVSVLFHNSSSAEGARRGVVGWDVGSMMRYSIIPWLIILIIFGAGFYWEFRRASR